MAKKNKNFKDSSPEDLKKNLLALQEDLRVLRFKAQGAKSKNVKEGKAIRKQIAQILTEQNRSVKN